MTRFNRREFFQLSAFGTAGLALGDKGRDLTVVEKPWNASAGRALRKFRNPIRTVCRICAAHCGIVAHRDGDRVCQILGSTGAPTNEGGLCPRAFAGLERLYDAERQLTPMRRIGKRGSGQWMQTTWADALSEIDSRLRGGGGTPVRMLHLGQEEILVQELREELGLDQILVDQPFPGRPGPGSGERWYGAPTLSPDASRTRTIFLFGAGPLDGRVEVPLVRRLMKALRAGATAHLFDSFEGATGSAVKWHAVVPGAESVVAWGIARLLLDRGVFRQEELATRVKDSPESLRAALARYTPETVEKTSGLTPNSLVDLARRFAEERPALALAPPGSFAEPAAALLNHLAGSINVPGGIPTARGPFFVQPLNPIARPEEWLNGALGGGSTVDLYWAVDANPAYDSPRSDDVSRLLADPSRIKLLVTMDTHLTETAALSDIFLPLSTHLESWGLLEGCLPDGRPYLYLQQPVTRASEPQKLKDPATEQLALFEPWPKPLGEARSLPDALLSLAQQRSAAWRRFPDTHAYLGDLLRKSWGPGSFEALQSRGIWVSEEGRAPNPVTAVSLLQAIPPAPSGEGPGKLQLITGGSATLPRSYANNRWGREIDHSARAWLHRATAKEIGVAEGEWVIVRTQAGEAKVRVRLIEGIHPRAVMLPDGFGHRGGGSVAQAKEGPPSKPGKTYLVSRSGSLDNPLGISRKSVEPGEPIWWSHEGPGVSVRALYPFRLTPEGVQDWGALPVEIRKA